MKLNYLFILSISFSAHLLFSSEENINPEAEKRAAILAALRRACYPAEPAPSKTSCLPRTESLPSTIDSDTPTAQSVEGETFVDGTSFVSAPKSSNPLAEPGSLKIRSLQAFQTNNFVALMLQDKSPSLPLFEEKAKQVNDVVSPDALFVLEGVR